MARFVETFAESLLNGESQRERWSQSMYKIRNAGMRVPLPFLLEGRMLCLCMNSLLLKVASIVSSGSLIHEDLILYMACHRPSRCNPPSKRTAAKVSFPCPRSVGYNPLLSASRHGLWRLDTSSGALLASVNVKSKSSS